MVICYAGKGNLWAFDPLKKKGNWSKVAMKGAPPTGRPSWNQLNYDPDHKCFLYLNVLNVGGGGVGGRTDGVFAFRLDNKVKKVSK